MWENVVYLSIGAVISIITTLIVKLIDFSTMRIGKFEIYIKNISIGILDVKLQIKNTTNSIKFLRDVKICQHCNNNKIELMQINESTISSNNQIIETIKYGENGSYSFIVKEKSFRDLTLEFNSQPFNFDKCDYTLEFFDENDNLIIYQIPRMEKNKWCKLSQEKQK